MMRSMFSGVSGLRSHQLMLDVVSNNIASDPGEAPAASNVDQTTGAISYGAGLFSPHVDPAEFGRRFHGHDERVDVESLGLTVELWGRVLNDLMG